MENERLCFLVDWREEDDAIVQLCEEIIQTGRLTVEFADVDTPEGFEMHIRYGEQRLKVPLTFSEKDRHITLHTLNRALEPDYEIRYLTASHGSGTGAFVPLSSNAWNEIERDFPDAVRGNFLRIAESPNLFTDVIRLPSSRKKKWWQILR